MDIGGHRVIELLPLGRHHVASCITGEHCTACLRRSTDVATHQIRPGCLPVYDDDHDQ